MAYFGMLVIGAILGSGLTFLLSAGSYKKGHEDGYYEGYHQGHFNG